MTNFMTAVTTDQDGSTYNMQGAESGNRTCLVQVSLGGGTGNVLIQGRMHSSHSWVTIKTFTADGADEVSMFPQMRAKTTSLSSASVHASTTARGVVLA